MLGEISGTTVGPQDRFRDLHLRPNSLRSATGAQSAARCLARVRHQECVPTPSETTVRMGRETVRSSTAEPWNLPRRAE